MVVFLKVYDFSSSGVGRPSANAAGGGGQRGQRRYDADCDRGDPPAFSDALEHGNPFVGLYVTIKYLHAGVEESVAQHCQTGATRRRPLCHNLPETATQFGASKRDAVSARPTLAAIPSFSGPHQQSRSQKIYEQVFDTHPSTCAFSVEKLCYSKNSIASRLFLLNGRYLINY